MEKWVMSIVGIVALSVLLDIIMPDGDLNKYIKGVFAMLTVTVIVAPLPRFLGEIKNGDIDIWQDSEEIIVDESFVADIEDDKRKRLEQIMKDIIVTAGGENVVVEIIDIDSTDMAIDVVEIVLDKGYGEHNIRQLVMDNIRYKVNEVRVIERSG